MKKTFSVLLLGGLLLGGCATVPTGPSVMALPGSQKSFEVFRADDYDCRRYAGSLTMPASDDAGVRSAVVGTAVGALAGAAINGHRGAGVGAGTGLLVGSMVGSDEARAQSHGTQRDYDQAYIQCMYGRGHRVPVSAQFARSLPPAAAPVAPAGGVTGPDLPPPPAYPPTSVPPADFRP